eukprot:TRINITY_DN9990_c0_g1_i1.p1 TRINITY_DN9990_c0_g1~~TRINITY_DN9990_c0_g1_i1.p1  ORF type:complete len:286 (+),score=46.85 TRINITY_DN9990_c0_g1_i1:321-1178(+)
MLRSPLVHTITRHSSMLHTNMRMLVVPGGNMRCFAAVPLVSRHCTPRSFFIYSRSRCCSSCSSTSCSPCSSSLHFASSSSAPRSSPSLSSLYSVSYGSSAPPCASPPVNVGRSSLSSQVSSSFVRPTSVFCRSLATSTAVTASPGKRAARERGGGRKATPPVQQQQHQRQQQQQHKNMVQSETKARRAYPTHAERRQAAAAKTSADVDALLDAMQQRIGGAPLSPSMWCLVFVAARKARAGAAEVTALYKRMMAQAKGSHADAVRRAVAACGGDVDALEWLWRGP